MAGLAQLEQRIAKLEAAAEDIREATREAHEAIKTLKLLKKEVEHLLVDKPKELFDELMAEQVRRSLDAYHEVIKRKQKEAVDQVGRTFDELARIYLEGSGGKHRDVPLPTIAEAARRRGQ